MTEMRFKMRWGIAVGSCVGFDSAFSSYFGEAAAMFGGRRLVIRILGLLKLWIMCELVDMRDDFT